MDTKNPDSMHKILVVDDEKSIREVIYDFLTMEGYSVTTADDGMNALKVLQGTSFDLMIVDLVMPNIGGAEILDWLSRENLKIPSLVISGLPLENLKEDLRKRGAFDCIPKPFQLKHLSHMVQVGLNQE
ncbi:MAG: response regulator [Thermodesulfobacteriota bacterium]|nr:response regulator [Thermodesulfobacteriota bacterium]